MKYVGKALCLAEKTTTTEIKMLFVSQLNWNWIPLLNRLNSKLYRPPTPTYIDVKESICLNSSRVQTSQVKRHNFAYYPSYCSIAQLLVGMWFDRQVPAVWVFALLPAYLRGIMWHCRLYIKSEEWILNSVSPVCVCVCLCVLLRVFDAKTMQPSVFMCVWVCAPGSLWCLKDFGVPSDWFVWTDWLNCPYTCHSPLDTLTIASKVELQSNVGSFVFVYSGNNALMTAQEDAVTCSFVSLCV